MRKAAFAFLFAVLSTATRAQAAPLSEYVGTYAYEPGHVLEIVAGDELYAVIDEAKYRLSSSGSDEFTAASGDRIQFRRDASGTVTGYKQDGQFHPRRSADISAASAALTRARPPGQDRIADYRYRVPADLHDGIAVGDIAATPLGADMARRIVASVLDGTYKDVDSVLLYQDGRLVMEEYFYGYDEARPHQMRSATKSVVGALAGIAVDRKALGGADEPVLPHLSYASYDHPDPRKAGITLGHLLSMSSGLACNDYDGSSPGREMVIDEAPDWVKATMDLPMVSAPGSVAHYCSGGVAVVGRVTENAVHMSLPDFAQIYLFGPLGMRVPAWNYDLTNADKEYSQIHLRPRDMLKLGMLYAQDGQWQGRQIISSAWVRASLAQQSILDGTGYGYFWWRPWLNVQLPAGAQHVYFNSAQGNGGQKIYLLPQYGLVAVFTASDYNSGTAPPNKIMANIILPALMSAAAH